MNLRRLLIQASLGEMVFSKRAQPNIRLSGNALRPFSKFESELPEVLLLCKRTSRRSWQLRSCTRFSSAKENFEILASGETEIGPLKRLVRWRVERRFGEPIISSTFIAIQDELRSASLLIEEEKAKITIENYISNKWKRIRQPLVPSGDLIADSPLVLIVRRSKYFGKRSTSIPTIAIEPQEDFNVVDQDIDFENSPMGGPVHWRIEKRGDDKVYCSKMVMTADQIRRFYGMSADDVIGSSSEMTVTIETYPSDAWQKIRRSLIDPRIGRMIQVQGEPIPRRVWRHLMEVARKRSIP